MKRDMNLVRLLLLRAEGEDPVDLSTYSEEQVNYHESMLLSLIHISEPTRPY